ncbi:MAG: carboxymuconolactone decarboxylase family protein [Bacteroidia bacterium]
METALQNETLVELTALLGLEPENSGERLVALSKFSPRYLKDLKVNISNMLRLESLSEREKMLLVLTVAVNERHALLSDCFEKKSRSAGASDEEIAEVFACVSMLQANNIFYRFRHFTKKEFYEKTPAGIKMTIMMSPVLGKEFFELLSLCISALNGCELCVSSHEQSVLRHGGSEQRIFDSIRLTSVFKGLVGLI